MTRERFALRLLIVLLGGAVGCKGGPAGSGVMKDDARDLPPFSEVEVSHGLLVDITAGTDQAIVVTGDDNLVEQVKTSVKDGRLVIQREGEGRPTKRFKVRVGIQALNHLGASGGAEARAEKVDSERFVVAATGGARVSLSGRAIELVADVTGGATLDGRNFRAEKAKLDGTGGSSSEIHASKELVVTLSGGAKAKCWGTPKSIKRNISGGAEFTVE